VEDCPDDSGEAGVRQPIGIVGRQHEFEQLNNVLYHVAQGARQVVFVTGEPGIGKTALIDAFCRELCLIRQALIARGQSVEGFAGKEAYYPVMEVIGQLCTQGDRNKNLRMLQQKAPGWYAKCASRLLAGEAPVAGPVMHEHMLCEICDAIEAMAGEEMLVLVFEDLHWADHSSLDLISALGRRRNAAKLLVLASYRPMDVSTGDHPLKLLTQDLVMRKLGSEVALRPLDKSAVNQYLIRELNQETLPNGLASFVHQHSEGNPLFMIATLEHLIAQGFLRKEGGNWQLRSGLAEIEIGVPTTLCEMIEMQIERLDASDQRLLEAASLIGVVFPAWAAAAALAGDLEEVEDQCEKLRRRTPFLHPAGHDELPDGTQSAFYVFAHGFYREVLYARQSPSRRARRHLRVAEKLETLFAGRESDVSREIALHFEAAGEWVRAAQALRVAAQRALRRGAHDEGVKLMEHAMRLLENLDERDRAAAQRKICKIAGIGEALDAVLRP
jgi:predicted ATPase